MRIRSRYPSSRLAEAFPVDPYPSSSDSIAAATRAPSVSTGR